MLLWNVSSEDPCGAGSVVCLGCAAVTLLVVGGFCSAENYPPVFHSSCIFIPSSRAQVFQFLHILAVGAKGLFQDVPQWPIDHFEWRWLEGQLARERCSGPLLPTLWNQEINLPCESDPPCTRMAEGVLSPEREWEPQRLNKQTVGLLLFFYSFTTLAQMLFRILI